MNALVTGDGEEDVAVEPDTIRAEFGAVPHAAVASTADAAEAAATARIIRIVRIVIFAIPIKFRGCSGPRYAIRTTAGNSTRVASDVRLPS
ncbi:MAG TPA: hypothetical protein VFR11_17020 [Micromonosporaceae bacterium]|nr:hypothetical protein [Micromonosporaceae bacterium]